MTVLNVLLHGEPVGTLTRVSGDRTLHAFSEAYVADEQRPVPSPGFKDELGRLITDRLSDGSAARSRWIL